ncbi:MAG TPA: bifunctional tetrahydrofolate synthase/dihydrofolate synthase [Steroidobacteraceae bacterium]|nr:bifunctional tetrahydrofolate synthase/dihydrofolate synthase [Steroidobacteraceae bacterium]
MPAGPRFDRLEDWLDWQQRLHPTTIELGLDRVARVLSRTGWRRPAAPVITVGGTNGKGSTVALLDAILRAAGHRVGTFTSPHLVDYRERIRLQGAMISEASLVGAFERIADALGPDSLTYFEFNTLAALLVFETAGLDAIVLEVGLGGRLDAVNVVDADVAVVVSIALDHMDYLGADEEAIGREKAGIFRPGRPAVFGSPRPPHSLRDEAARLGAHLLVRGERFDGVPRDAATWDFVVDGAVAFAALSRPGLAGTLQVANAATALMTLRQLADRRPVARAAIERGLRAVALPGRFQRVRDGRRGVEWVLDVAHNPAAAASLAANLREMPAPGRTLAVCGMLGDKDVPGVVTALRDGVDAWYAATSEGPRAIDAHELARRAAAAGVAMQPSGTIAEAMARAGEDAKAGDRIVVFGSFHTVGPALVWLGVPL